MVALIYFTLVVAELLFLISVTIYIISLIYSSLMGAPYVPSRKKLIASMIKEIKVKKHAKVLEVGCGDGRFLRMMAEAHKTTGLGIDINPVVIFLARLKTRLAHVTGIEFNVKNMFKQSMKGYDVIYLFLMPEMLEKLVTKLKNETTPSTLVISHGFRIPGCDRYVTNVLSGQPFETYFYRFSNRRHR